MDLVMDFGEEWDSVLEGVLHPGLMLAWEEEDYQDVAIF